MRMTSLAPMILAAVAVVACQTEAQDERSADQNPLLIGSGLSYGMPPFDRIRNEHYAPALEAGMAEERAEIDAIAADPEPPSFENTIVALEQAGQTLMSVARVFSNIVGTHTNDELQAVQREMSPKLAAHSDETFLNAELFARIETLYEQRDELGLDPESKRLLERYYTDFVRAGALLGAAEQERLREINARLAELGTAFTQSVLAEVNDSAVAVDDASLLDGLSDAQIRAAADEAKERGLEGKWVITLVNTSGQPPLTELTDRGLRERIHRASLVRNSRGNEHDTRAIISETVRLRAERARMLGYDTHADYVIEEQTAESVGAVNEMLGNLGPVAVANARAEAAAIQRVIEETEEEPFELASWDWAFYAEKVRREQYDFEESEVRPYFELQNVLENGVFYSATRLFGVTFERRDDLPTYHPDVQVWEVFEEDGTPLGLMLGDFYARGSKRGGAWMNSYSIQSHLLGGQPVVGNHLNITKPPEGEPTLMTWDEVTTLFHEFGHVLHGLFSNVTYPRFAATAVPRDFVEYPSQVYEMWASWPEVLENYALHHETGERIPQALLERVLAAEQFNQGFRTTEYLAASITDQALHQLAPEDVPSAQALLDFEATVLSESGMQFEPVPPRYRYPYFSHLFTHAYSAGYYSYIWSEVLDADSVQWFEDQGGLTRENGEHYREHILSRGGSADAMELYRAFAGRDPEIEHLLRKRGLLGGE
jgi:peptidyl-dipeptidase Dcp